MPMLTKNDIVSKLRELKPDLKKKYLVKEIGLFGSFADNTNTENSDIDLLIEFEKPIGWKYFSLEIYLEQLFDRKIDLVTRGALKEQIKESILNHVHII
jgi:predicted nucleotidyltransferase